MNAITFSLSGECVAPKTSTGEFMQKLAAGILSMTLMASGALAASDAGPLAPGKPASVKRAQEIDRTALIVIVGIVAAGLAIGLATSSDGNPGGPVALTTVPTNTG
jgi:hypothetical protein